MRHLIEFPLEDGNILVIEADWPKAEGGIVPAARPDEIAVKAVQTFEAALEKVKPAATAIIDKLRSLADAPDEVSVEFGLKMSAEAGAVVAAVGTEANYKVILKWAEKNKREESP